MTETIPTNNLFYCVISYYAFQLGKFFTVGVIPCLQNKASRERQTHLMSDKHSPTG